MIFLILGQLDDQIEQWLAMYVTAHPGPLKDEADRIYGKLRAIRDEHTATCEKCKGKR